MLTPQKQKALIAFKKARTHLDNVIAMTENGQYCVAIMQQNLALIGLLKSAHSLLMANHLNSCFKSAMSSRNTKKQQKMIDEILTVTKFLNK